MKVSVCIATYNGAKYIKAQLESILCQIQNDDEVIISDDGSTDLTIQIIESFKDNRIKVFKNSFHNYNKNFEFALSKAQGDYIFLSDQDDIWLPSKYATMCEALSKYDLVDSDCYIVDADLQIKRNSFFTTNNKRSGFWRNLFKNNYLGCCMAFRQNILQKALPFPPNTICHDGWIGIVGDAFGKTLFIDDKLLYYRRHSSNASNTTQGSTLSIKTKISYRWTMLWVIFVRKYLNN